MSVLGLHIHVHIYVNTHTTYHIYTCKEENQKRSFLSVLKLLLLLSETGSHCAALVGLKLSMQARLRLKVSITVSCLPSRL